MVRHEGHPDDSGHEGQPTCRSRRHEPGMAPQLAAGLGICPSCRDLTEKTLIELPALFELCADAIEPRPNETPERVGGHRPSGVVRDAGVSVRSDILGVLAAWSGVVTVERGVAGPDELAIRKLVGFLAIHVHWLCSHPRAADFADEVTGLADSVNEAMRPDAGFRVAEGACPHPGCDQTVYAEAQREGAEPYEVSCGAGHVWAPRHWLALRAEQNGPGGGPSPSAEGAE
ncbi:hypothetical protein SAMN05192558_10272 [Actinokineospora alba]|uniref:Uncharacterized protein n=1 Tax=Actinokineospora alba TaxID=504798 RepID=A0A1H0HEB5_9PSEU|nr:hypothetical protein [Actinokineospora alba]TDP64929.1 hypothetical protein C8E96_0407 [Actinokineospora alba]SDH49626.1 hypothetical protein SAMN05421871_101231 [Actinokineospora alba]SDO17191.1 hypothetical protein SAMN05192558_10272 [Actinokineospora alba]